MRIAIAGFAIEGKASYSYWNKPDNQVVIIDERDISAIAPLDASFITGGKAFQRLDGFDLVVRTAGLSPSKIKTDGRIWSATNEFFDQCPAPIIGVTGTKGKGTISSLITAILRAAGKKVHLVGNIGQPALEILPNVTSDDIVVYELSSFQLWDLEKSPTIAVISMIEPDHLDVHENFEDYIKAKSHITLNQLTTDRVVYFANNQYSSQVASQSVGQRLPYPSDQTTRVLGDYFYYQDTELCGVDQLQLVGEHNIQNACAAITAVWPWVQDGSVIAEGLRSFDGLPHRLKLVREVKGVRYFDDSIATTPGSAIAAMRAFDGSKIIILGGSDKGADYTEVISVAKNTKSRVIAIGQTGEKIEALCKELGVEARREYGLMSDIVPIAASLANYGDVVILSPASASFDQYINYSDRGDKFIDAVNRLKDSTLADR